MVDRADDDAVFKALADSGRRALLDALFAADGQTLGQLTVVLPAMTRFGVMKHLTVLERAGLVTALRDGRCKRHYLNPVPIQALQRRWISKYADAFATAITDLRDDLEHPAHRARPAAEPAGA